MRERERKRARERERGEREEGGKSVDGDYTVKMVFHPRLQSSTINFFLVFICTWHDGHYKINYKAM